MFYTTVDNNVIDKICRGQDNSDEFEFDGSASGGSSDEGRQTKSGSRVPDPEKMTDEEIYLVIQEKLEQVLAQKKGCQNKLKVNKLTTEKLTEEWETNYAVKNCTFCKKQYSPFNNGPESCSYHWGKVRYIQCRGCGRDEYFTCCLKCRICSAGCRSGPHAPHS